MAILTLLTHVFLWPFFLSFCVFPSRVRMAVLQEMKKNVGQKS